MLIVSRDDVIPVLNNVVVAPVTNTVRTIPTCIPVGRDEGIDRDSVATFDNLAAVPKSMLTRRLGRLGPGGRERIGDAPGCSGELLTKSQPEAGDRPVDSSTHRPIDLSTR